MTRTHQTITPHAYFLDALFAYKSKVNHIFKNILGLYHIHHIAISHINEQHELLTFSSTPSLEFNLFNSDLWQFDNTYHSSWYESCSLSPWQLLYTPERYDDLFFSKQIKFDYPLGLSLALKMETGHIVCSLASHQDTPETCALFASHYQSFYKISQYCSQLLLPLFTDCNQLLP